MGFGMVRHQLVHRINTAFHHDQIAASAHRVAHLGHDADAFDIIHGLGLFEFPKGTTLDAYRSGLAIPDLHKIILKNAFQAAVQHKQPLTFAVVSGPSEAVQVTTSNTHIHVVLTRTD
jgi:hypothetical protein